MSDRRRHCKVGDARVLVLASALDHEPRTIFVARPMTVAQVVRACGIDLRRPTMAVLVPESGKRDPKPVLRRYWATRKLRAGQTLCFVPVPGRGNNATLIATVATLALAIAVPFAAPALAGAMGFVAGTTAAKVATSLIGAGMLLAGSMIISRLVPEPAPQATPEAEQVYLARAASNRLMPGELIPDLQGRLRYPPPFASRPFGEFTGGEMHLNQLFCMGIGKIDVTRWEQGDTLVWTAAGGFSDAIEDAEIEVVHPGDDVTLFPANVVTSPAVTGQEVPDPPDLLGPHAVSAPGTTVNRIVADVVFPAGLIHLRPNGNTFPVRRIVTIEVREIDSGGDPLGAWETLIERTFELKTRTPQRFSIGADVDDGRYEARLSATESELLGDFGAAEGQVLGTLQWAGLRGFVGDFVTPPGATLVAVRFRATATSPQSAEQNFFTGERLTPKFINGAWTAPQSVDGNPAWIAAEMIRSDNYNIGLSDAEFDRGWLVAYAGVFEARGDRFDGLFDRQWGARAALDAVLRTGRSYSVRLGPLLGFIRDEPKQVRRFHFTRDTIVRGSVKRHWRLNSDDSPTHMAWEFLDADSGFAPRVVEASIGAIGSELPQREQAFGFTSHDHAWREAVTRTAEHAYRNDFRTVTVEQEGRMLVRGDPVLLDDPLYERTGFARVDSRAGDVLALDRDAAVPLGPWNFDADGQGWTAASGGSPETVASLTGVFVDDAVFGARAIERTGTATAAIRQKDVQEPVSGRIYELQVIWRAVEGAGRVRSRAISLDGDFAVLSSVGAYSATATPGDGIQISKFHFSDQAADGIAAWHASAEHLRFGINRDQSDAETTIRVAEIRVREVQALGEHATLRDKRGREWGPVDAVGTRRLRLLHLDSADRASVEGDHGDLDDVLPDVSLQEPAHVTILQGADRLFDGLLVAARPVGDRHWEVVLVNDDQRVHLADGTEIIPSPWTPPSLFAPVPEAPEIVGLFVSATRGPLHIELTLGWQPASGASRYTAELSYDEAALASPDAAAWTAIGDTAGTRLRAVIDPEPVTVRVTAIGVRQGPWAYKQVLNVPGLVMPAGLVAEAALHAEIRAAIDRTRAAAQGSIERGQDLVARQLDRLSAETIRLAEIQDTLAQKLQASAAGRTRSVSDRLGRDMRRIEGSQVELIQRVEVVELIADDEFLDAVTTIKQTLLVQFEQLGDDVALVAANLIDVEVSLRTDLDQVASVQQDIIAAIDLIDEEALSGASVLLLVQAEQSRRLDGTQGQHEALAQRLLETLALLDRQSQTMQAAVGRRLAGTRAEIRRETFALTTATGAIAGDVAEATTRLTTAEGAIVGISNVQSGLLSEVADHGDTLVVHGDTLDSISLLVFDASTGNQALVDITSTQGGAITANADAINLQGGSITAIDAELSQVRTREGGFDALLAWRGFGGLDEWSAVNGSKSDNGGYLRFVAEDGVSRIQISGLSFSGSANRYISLKLRMPAEIGLWSGQVQFSTSGHGFSTDFRKDFAAPAIGQWTTLLLDMGHGLTAGGNNWRISTITGLRIATAIGTGDITDYAWVGVGRDALGASAVQQASHAGILAGHAVEIDAQGDDISQLTATTVTHTNTLNNLAGDLDDLDDAVFGTGGVAEIQAGLVTDVSDIDGVLSALSTAFTDVFAETANGAASAMFRMIAQSTSGSVTALIALEAKAEVAGSFPGDAAALHVGYDSSLGGFIELAADRTFITDSNGNPIAVFDALDGKIGFAADVDIAGNLNLAGELNFGSMAPGAITQPKGGASGSGGAGSAYVVAATMSGVVVDSAVETITINVSGTLTIGRTSGAAGVELWMRIRIGNNVVTSGLLRVVTVPPNDERTTPIAHSATRLKSAISNGTYNIDVAFRVTDGFNHSVVWDSGDMHITANTFRR